jgi:hypothetical protein
VWWCSVDVDGRGERVSNPATRAAAAAELRTLLAEGGRVLVGWDFPLGYPAGFAAALGLTESALTDRAWLATWSLLASSLHDGPDNRNDRFALAAALNARVGPGPGPFWGCPPSVAGPHLSPRKAPGFPHHGLAELRECERRVVAAGRWLSSPWQLLGAGSVGSQALTGIPVVHRLLHEPPAPSEVWPLTTGLTLDPTAGRADVVVHAEVWPSALRSAPEPGQVRDEAQVRATARHLAALGRRSELATAFAPAPDDPDAVVAEEGWILGVAGSTPWRR